MTYCGNEKCAYNCCCNCPRRFADEHCFYCSTGPNSRKHKWGNRCCGIREDRDKYICLDCKKCWKIQLHPLTNKQQEKIFESGKGRNCPNCQKEGQRVSHVFRAPKYKDNQAWEVLKIIMDPKLFSDTLAYHWFEEGGIGCSLHLINKQQEQFWVPTKKRDVSRWMEYMRGTKLIRLYE